MLDSDLALIYGVTTGRLNEQVKRNLRRFPADFMFRLTMEEQRTLVSRIPTANTRGGRRKRALVFTQEGVAMLSSALKSHRAVQANVSIMRAFVRYREALAVNPRLASKLEELEDRIDVHDGEIGEILKAIRGLIDVPRKRARRIGFKAAPGRC